MELFYPISQRPFSVNQPFGGNANTYYAEGGLRGHTGIDLPCGYGEPIYAACDALVYSVRNVNNQNLMQYRAVYTLWERDGVAYEVSYGHAKDIFIKEGDVIRAGTPLITGGNTGDVASGGIKITRAMKNAGSTAGTHLHFQVRPLKRSDVKEPGKKYLQTLNGYFKKDGQFFEMLDMNNGYAGCIDPAQFWNGQYANENIPDTNRELMKLIASPNDFKHEWTQNLAYGQYGLDIKYAQIAFMILGFLEHIPEDELGFFGNKTRIANGKYQQAHEISPVPGRIGPKTRASLNSEFKLK